MYTLLVKVRSAVLVFLTHNMALPILKIIRKPEIFPFTAKELQEFPEGTMGKQLISMLQQKDLQLLPYYARHDIKHILLNYDTTDEGEVSLQAFMLGNKHFSFPVIATVLYGFLTMPEHWKAFRIAYRRGRNSPSISGTKWFEILNEQTKTLQTQLQLSSSL